MNNYIFIVAFSYDGIDADIFKKLGDDFYLIKTISFEDYMEHEMEPIIFQHTIYNESYIFDEHHILQECPNRSNEIDVLFQTHDSEVFKNYCKEFRLVYHL